MAGNTVCFRILRGFFMYARCKGHQMWLELGIQQARADSTKLLCILTPASVANHHGDFLNTDQSLTATVLGISVSFSEGWLLSQVVLWYHQPALPIRQIYLLKPTYSTTQITNYLTFVTFLYSALLDTYHLSMMTFSRWSTPFVTEQLTAEHLSKPHISKTSKDYIHCEQQNKKLMLVICSFLFSDYAYVYAQVL